MRTSPFAALGATSALLGVAAASATAGTVHFGINKNRAVESKQLRRRDSTVQVDLGNAEYYGLYYANISVGTPPQDLSLQIDTGSSDVWVPAASAQICSNERQGGCPGGSFDQTSSSTYVDVETKGFDISYVDGSGSSGDYFQDTFKIGGATLEGFEMGLALDTTIAIGIMGIGYNDSEANVYTGNGTIYPNLGDAMVNAGVIPTKAYSLWLNDLQATTGNVLFGGIDTDKYSGELIAIDVFPTEGSGTSQVTSFTVAWTMLSASSTSGTDTLTPSGYSMATILDSGTTITLLPDDIAATVFAELGASSSKALGITTVPCPLADNGGTLNYQFGGSSGPVISVPMSELVIPIELSDGSAPTYGDGTAVCQLGIEAAGDLPVLFGDTFLRSAYVVYDLVNNQVALAPTDFNSSSSHVVAFASYGAPVPSAATLSAQPSVSQTATGVPRVGASASSYSSVSTVASSTAVDASTLSAASGFAQTTNDATPSNTQTSVAIAGTTTTGTSTATASSTTGAAAGLAVPRFDWSSTMVLALVAAWMGVGGGMMLI